MVHSTLKAAKAQAPCQARRRSTGSVTSRRSDEPTRSPVAAVGAWALGGQGPPQDGGEADHEAGREPVDGPPARHLGHQARHGAGQQDPQQQARS